MGDLAHLFGQLETYLVADHKVGLLFLLGSYAHDDLYHDLHYRLATHSENNAHKLS